MADGSCFKGVDNKASLFSFFSIEIWRCIRLVSDAATLIYFNYSLITQITTRFMQPRRLYICFLEKAV
jgi:hypothetical protein